MFCSRLTKIMAGAAFYWVLCIMAILKKCSVFFLAAVYLLPARPVTEFLKLPQLVQHYFEYRHQNHNSSFSAFLVQHYLKEDGTDKDAAEDSRLPFKSSEQILTSGFVSLYPPQPVTITPAVIFATEKKYTHRNNDRLPVKYPDAIWQPPRHC